MASKARKPGLVAANVLFLLGWIGLDVALPGFTRYLLSSYEKDFDPLQIEALVFAIVLVLVGTAGSMGNIWYFSSKRLAWKPWQTISLISYNICSLGLWLFMLAGWVVGVGMVILAPDQLSQDTENVSIPITIVVCAAFCAVFVLCIWINFSAIRAIFRDRRLSTAALSPLDQWKQERKSLRWFSVAARFEALIALAVAPFLIIFAVGRMVGVHQQIGSLEIAVIALAAIVWIIQIQGYIVNRRRIIADVRAISQLPVLDAKLSGMSSMIQNVARALEIEKPVRSVLNIRDFTICASTTESAHTATIVVPLGLVKLYRQDPDSARGIIAHELAHVAQNDTMLWRRVDCWWQNYVIGTIVLLFLASLVGAIKMVNGDVPQESSGGFEASAGMIVLIMPVFLVIQFVPIICWLIFSRHMRRKAETLADLGAGVVSNVNKMIDLLKQEASLNTQGEGFFSVHPNAGWRVEKLQQIFTQPSEQQPAGGAVYVRSFP